MTISGNINITCNESENIKTLTIFNNNTPLNIEYSATLASLEAIHNEKPDAHAELFNAIKSKNETQDTQISELSSTKADKSELPTVNNASLTITQGGTTKGTFTANASSDTMISLDAGCAWGSITGTLSDQTDLNSTLGGKADIDLSNITPTQTVKNTIINWGMPDWAKAIDISSSFPYTCPSDGYLFINNWNGYVEVGSDVCTAPGDYVASGTSNARNTGMFPVVKNEKLTLSATYNNWETYFVPMKGV